jgi:hypothetical protein
MALLFFLIIGFNSGVGIDRCFLQIAIALSASRTRLIAKLKLKERLSQLTHKDCLAAIGHPILVLNCKKLQRFPIFYKYLQLDKYYQVNTFYFLLLTSVTFMIRAWLAVSPNFFYPQVFEA